MGQRFERAKAGQIEVAEEAGRVSQLWLDQRHVQCCGTRGQILGNGSAADATANHHDASAGLASCHPRAQRRGTACPGKAAELTTRPSHGGLVPVGRAVRYSASVATSPSLSERAIACMIWLERAPDLKAAMTSANCFWFRPTIDGMPLSRPSMRWQDAHIAAS